MKFIHKVTAWRRSGINPIGEPEFTRIGVIDARWEDRVTVTIGSDGRQERSRSTVYLAAPVRQGDLIVFGVNQDSAPPKEAAEVRAYQEVPNLRNTRVVRRAQL